MPIAFASGRHQFGIEDAAAGLPAPQPDLFVTDAQAAACYFVGALAQDIDARRGVIAENGTPETRTKVIDVVLKRFFTP